ncbi:uncharacterized protein DNG_00418 [Cephalotrichum gorgonifer]|uniref:DH domain-containing protein n=1 Tax=Cephalotrichum gorgonifer TaxID=2041049 RepID=A0AAE8MPY0_9PEZI|nr:uncharacterized protein DNG_00418 [Cephalotrichum gorgonifer]
MAPSEVNSPFASSVSPMSSSSSNASFVTATRKSSFDNPETPPEPSREPMGNEPDVVDELGDNAVDGVEGLDELAGMASAVLTLASDLKCPEEAGLIPPPAFDSHDFLPLSEHDSSSTSTPPRPTLLRHRPPPDPSENDSLEPGLNKGPFQKWMKSLHRRANDRSRRLREARTGTSRDYLDSDDLYSLCPDLTHTKSSSGSSFAFVSAVKSASIGLASISTRTKSRLGTVHSRDRSRTDRSSRLSTAAPRFSDDSARTSDFIPPPDPAAIGRSLRRRSIIEELITTEEDYIGDVRFLMNAYITTLASLPQASAGLRSSINRNLAEIVELHEEILGELHRAVPNSEYTQLELPKPHKKSSKRPHQRWRSLDSVPENTEHVSWLERVPGMVADSQVAEEVAKIFGKRMNRFFIYKEYGVKYEMMIKDLSSVQRALPALETYQKGFEVLASSLGSEKSRTEQANKKASTIGDLLVKPIQRMCRYPLLFAELLKYTPVDDCANSHMEVENTLIRLREATAEINRATDDTRMRSVLEQTWILQDRLVFANQRLDASSKNRIRSFGHIKLCGALHVCWNTKDSIEGQYMVCLLYQDVLCLASAGKADQIYTIQAAISLASAKVEEVDDGRGLQCHTALYSWKVVFECDCQLYEIIMTACTPKEELEWRCRLTSPFMDQEGPKESNWLGWLSMDIKPLGTVFGKPGTVARRLSIRRATTIGPKSSQWQVILKNTYVTKEPSHASAATTASINRSQSLLTTHHRTPILAPPRSERARIEGLLCDVWSRDILPFPGMTNRSRSEHLVRSSASSMMRRLSVASIASSFGRRPGSYTSLHKAMTDTDTGEGDDDSGRALGKTSGEDMIEWKTPFGDGSEGGDRHRLPMIRDERDTRRAGDQEDASADMPSEPVSPSDASPSEGTPRRLVWAHDEGRRGSLSSVLTSAANSQQLNQASSKQSPVPSEKENYQPEKVASDWSQQRKFKRAGLSRTMSGRSSVLSGFRGIFR